MLFDDCLRNFLNVFAAITVFWRWLALRRCKKGQSETIDLATVIVEVVFAGHFRAGSLQHTTQRVTHGSPAGSAKVNRSGWVCRNELEVHVQVGKVIGVSESLALCQNLGHNFTLCCCSKANVQKAWASDFSRINGVICSQCLCQPGSQIPRVLTDLFSHLQCNVGGVIAVLWVTRTLHNYLLRKNRSIELAGGQNLYRGLFNQCCEISWCHGEKF